MMGELDVAAENRVCDKWLRVLGTLLLFAPAVALAAPPLAMSQNVVNCAGTIVGSNNPVPGFPPADCSTMSADGRFGQDAHASTTGWLSGTGAPGDPLQVGRAEVSGAITGSVGGSMSASAQVLYYFDLTTIRAAPPPGSVTINIEANGSGSAAGGQYFSQVRINWGINEAFTQELITNTVNSGPSFSVVHAIDFIDSATASPLDWDALIWLTASCDAGNGVACDAFVDPIFSFADPNLANFYAFSFSPNIPLPPPPEEASVTESSILKLLVGLCRSLAETPPQPGQSSATDALSRNCTQITGAVKASGATSLQPQHDER